jgi:hypothetical protein
MENTFETMANYLRPSTKSMKLAAIWLEQSIMAENQTIKPTRRICEGTRVRVENNHLCDITETNPATHQITECRGTLQDTNFEISLIDLKTQELSTIKL